MNRSRMVLALLTPLLIAPDHSPCPECWDPAGLWLDAPCGVTGCDVKGGDGWAQLGGTLLPGDVHGATLKVEKGTTVVAVLWSTGADADLYLVEDGHRASFSDWDCRPYLAGGKAEVCSFTAAADGEASFMVHAWWGKVAYTVSITAS
jgi:hypothetical protein